MQFSNIERELKAAYDQHFKSYDYHAFEDKTSLEM